jgi:hypothetical protein
MLLPGVCRHLLFTPPLLPQSYLRPWDAVLGERCPTALAACCEQHCMKYAAPSGENESRS